MNEPTNSIEVYIRSDRASSGLLTPIAAITLCRWASENHKKVALVEGGIWEKGRFEARLDCIWDGNLPATTEAELKENNARAENFVRSESEQHNSFVLTLVDTFRDKS